MVVVENERVTIKIEDGIMVVVGNDTIITTEIANEVVDYRLGFSYQTLEWLKV